MYTAKNFDHLCEVVGFSEKMMRTHIALYEGYVKNVNALEEILTQADHAPQTRAEITRRYGWEWNGMRLHELYFEGLTTETLDATVAPTIVAAITSQWGSIEKWIEAFRACGVMRGIGWVILAYDATTKRLHNVWINEHDTGHLAGTQPMIVMDVFEHAFFTDYGTDRVAYMDHYIAALDWERIEERFVDAQ